MNKTRILYVIPYLNCGGASKLALDILNFITREDGLDAKLCVLKQSDGFFTQNSKSKNIIFCDFNIDYRNILATRKCISGLCEVVKKYQPDIIHSFLWVADNIAAKTATIMGIPHVAHFIDTRPWLSSSRIHDKIKRFIYRSAMLKAKTQYIACTNEVRDYTSNTLDLDETCFSVIPNAIDINEYPYWKRITPAGDRKTILGTAGRFDREKGHLLLIKAASIMREHCLSFELRIAGDGILKPEYNRLISELKLQNHVKLTGLISDIYKFYCDLDLFIMPSLYSEGLPLAVLGAMSSGLPVIATRTAGVNDVIRDGIDGKLINENDPDVLAQAVIETANDTNYLIKAGIDANCRVKDSFDIRDVTARILKYYRSILE